MKIVNREALAIKGLSIRTNNADEMNPDTAKIAALHQRFDKQVVVNYKEGARVYGVYFDYESDHTGDFSVLAGADNIESSSAKLETVTLPAGSYLLFAGKGQMPQAVIDTWARVWAYFSVDGCPHARAYSVDYEYYKGPDEVDICIAVK